MIPTTTHPRQNNFRDLMHYLYFEITVRAHFNAGKIKTIRDFAPELIRTLNTPKNSIKIQEPKTHTTRMDLSDVTSESTITTVK